VIAYAIVGEDIPYTERNPIFVDGKLLGRVPRLAICENLGGEMGVLLFHCANDWSVLAASGGSTVEEEKRRAESNYPGVTALWAHLDTSREEALAYYDETTEGLKCSFCGKRPFEVSGLVTGLHASICRDCVTNFHAELSGSQRS
jgi:hypothetical protein